MKGVFLLGVIVFWTVVCNCEERGVENEVSNNDFQDTLSKELIRDFLFRAGNGNLKKGETCEVDEDNCGENMECVGADEEVKKCDCKKDFIGKSCIKDECKVGKYKNCKEENGNCKHNEKTDEFSCECKEEKKLHPVENICKDCSCGENEECSFKDGEKTCSCKTGYAKDDTICKDCACGENEECSFKDGEKTCSCKTDFAKVGGICKKTCKGNDECKNGGTCGEKEGNNFCQCRTGVEGDTCETVVECKSGIYKDCKEDAGKCSFDLKTNAAVCLCSGNKKLNDKKLICEDCSCDENEVCSFKDGLKTCSCKTDFAKVGGICKKTCKGNDECKNGGTCGEKEGNNFCQCRTGVEGDTCETVVECKSGIYKDCKEDAGKCSFDLKTNAAVCLCSGNKKLNDKSSSAKNNKYALKVSVQKYTFAFFKTDCSCDENEVCSFKDGLKTCSCKTDFAKSWWHLQKNMQGGMMNAKTVGHVERKEGNNFCQCRTGVEGDTCETVVETCEEDAECENGGTCVGKDGKNSANADQE
ncbi:EGF-like domain-containing protein [Caerostris extrusa]|uniref:EGF-like domain-containing protein n=1 Tax=Caerostris extrusa TaxID=172846 RepID=A0AAV4XVX4_CAEEX|nr:EGF-like domain-containing protein [Caerostris extrusa]